jgi:hypothetical protein
MNNVLGALVDLQSATVTVVACAVMLVGVGLTGLASSPLRNDRTGLRRR